MRTSRMPHNLAEALSPQERYAREIAALLARVDRQEAQAIREIRDLLSEARKRVIASLADLPAESVLAFYLTRLQRELDGAMQHFLTQAEAVLTDQAEAMW